MTTVLPPFYLQHFFDPNNTGVPLQGGKLFTYVAGTSTKQNTWTDSTQSVLNQNPIILDSRGECSMWLDPTLIYKLVLCTASDTDPPTSPLATQDNVSGPIGLALLTQQLIGALLYPRTPAEIAAGITPSNYAYPTGNVLRYGADPTGGGNSAPAFTSALTLGGEVTAQGNFRITSGLTLDISTTPLSGPCILTSELAANAGAMITITASGGPSANGKNVIRNILIEGNSATGVQGIKTVGGPQQADNFSIASVVFENLAIGLWIQNNSFEIELNGCSFSSCGSGTTIYALTVDFASSERNSMVQGAFFNCWNCIKQSSGGQIFLDNVSLDYTVNTIVSCTTGQVFMQHCYIESNQDNAYWLDAVGTNPASLIKLDNCMIAQTGAKPNFNYFHSGAGYGGGIYFQRSKLFNTTNSITPLLCAGSGNSFAKDNIVEGFLNNAFAWGGFSTAANLCSNYNFANGAGGLGGWTVGSHTGAGGNPTTSANTLLLQVTLGGQDQFAYWTLDALPGENIAAQCNVKSNNVNATFSLIISAVGADGTVITTSSLVPGLNLFSVVVPLSSSYQAVRASILCLPAGTAKVFVEVNTAGASNPAYLVSVQQLMMSKY